MGRFVLYYSDHDSSLSRAPPALRRCPRRLARRDRCGIGHAGGRACSHRHSHPPDRLGSPPICGCGSGRPPSLPDAVALSKALGVQLHGLLERGALPAPKVVIAATEGANLAAVAHGDTVLVLVPKAEKADALEVARAAAPALLLASAKPPAPDPRCGEPLLIFGAGVAIARSLPRP